MRRRVRWQVVVPRVLLALVLVLTFQYVLGIVARNIFMRSGESIIGVPVEAARARVSMLTRQIVLSDVRLADPQQQCKNIFQANRCELSFAATPLLHGEAVVEHGRLSGVRFGSAASCEPASKKKWMADDADLAARKWLDRLAERFTLAPASEFESVKHTEALWVNWSRRSAELNAHLEELHSRAAALQRNFDTASANPLRNDKVMDELPAKATTLQKDFATFREEVEKLPDALEIQRRAIVAARRNDAECGAKILALDPVDPNSLNAYLLREQATTQLNQLL